METNEISSLASLGRRALAALLDTLILAIPCAIAAHLLPVVGGFLVVFLYAPVLEASEVRATLGKHLMGIQVADIQGRRISFRAALIRNILKLVSSVLFMAGHVVALFTARRQTLHDLLAETVVVYGRSERSIADAWMETMKSLVGSVGPLTTGSASADASLSALERLQALRERGALSEEEFQAAKKKVLEGG